MLRLLLLRHAKADRSVDIDDHERPLSKLGQKQARKMGEYIRRQELIPDLAIISTARRAQETWTQAVDAGKIVTTRADEPKIYESSVDNLLEVIRRQDSKYSCIMLVGHNPGMERLTAWLAGSGDDAALIRLRQGFVVGSLAVIDIPVDTWSGLQAQGGRLVYFETPDTT